MTNKGDIKQSDKERKHKCRICEALGNRPVIGCVGVVFVTPYPKKEKYV